MKLWMAIVVFACACSSKKKSDSDHYGDFKPAEMKAALQGAWVGPSTSNLINSAAYEISGDAVKVFDGKEEKTFTLVVETPCQIGFKGADGSTYYMGAITKDGKLMWGGGDAGQRTGDKAVMCAGIQTWTVEKGVCNERSVSGRWKEAKDKCGFRQKDGKEEFFWTWMDKQEALPMDGDYLWEFKDKPARKVADYAAAKAELAADEKTD